MFHNPVYVNDPYGCFRSCVASMTGEDPEQMPLKSPEWPFIPDHEWSQWGDLYGYKFTVVKNKPRDRHYIDICDIPSQHCLHATVRYNMDIMINSAHGIALGRNVGYVTVTRRSGNIPRFDDEPWMTEKYRKLPRLNRVYKRNHDYV